MKNEWWIIQTKIRSLTRTDFRLAPLVGLEPTTCGLTVRRSTDWAKEECLCWHYLSSRAVTRQVLSAHMSLTSVFGMGTGGPSWQSIPTQLDGSGHRYIKSLAASNSKEIIAPQISHVKKNFRHILPQGIYPENWTLFSVCNLGSGQHWACLDQAFGLLVSVSLTHYCAYTSDLSTT